MLEEIRSSLARILKRFGMKDLDASVLAELMMEDDNLSVSDLKRRLSYSTSGITSSLHRLMRDNLVVRHRKGKKFLYRAEAGILSALHHLIDEIRKHDLLHLKKKLRTITTSNKHEQKIRMLKKRVDRMERLLAILLNHIKRQEEAAL